jgi:hypothetical protein
MPNNQRNITPTVHLPRRDSWVFTRLEIGSKVIASALCGKGGFVGTGVRDGDVKVVDASGRRTAFGVVCNRPRWGN